MRERRNDVIELDHRLLSTILEPLFPDTHVASVELLSGGFSNSNYHIRLAEPGTSVVLRLYAQEVLAVTQPLAHENALPLPTTIELRVLKAKFILFQAVFFALFLSIIQPLAVSQDPFTLRRFLLTFLISLPGGGLMGLLSFYLSGRHMEQTLVVDDQGITILHSRGNRHIDWQAAQFFGVHYDRKSHTTGL